MSVLLVLMQVENIEDEIRLDLTWIGSVEKTLGHEV